MGRTPGRRSTSGRRITERSDLSNVTSAFSGGPPLETVQEKLRLEKGEMTKVLEWLVAEGMLVQMAEYYLFVPLLADTARHLVDDPFQLEELDPALVDEFHPEHLSMDELHLLRSRSQDTSQLRFFCNFVVRVARAHLRMDTYNLEELVPQDKDRAPEAPKRMDLITANDDIFAKYVCRC